MTSLHGTDHPTSAPDGADHATGGPDDWAVTTDLDAFVARAGPYLRTDPALHTALLSVLDSLRSNGLRVYGEAAPVFGSLTDGTGEVQGAFLCTPPYPLQLCGVSTAVADSLAERLAREGESAGEAFRGVAGPKSMAAAFSSAWQERSGLTADIKFHQRLYRLDTLTPPSPAPRGRARVATRADRGRLMRWYVEFGRDIGEEAQLDPGGWADSRIAYGGVTLWEVDGASVAMAAVTRQVAGSVRVSTVYTPRELRGRGYAGAATADISRSACSAGAGEVLLFTDLANPTSNSLYQRIGYRPVQDFAVYDFTSPMP